LDLKLRGKNALVTGSSKGIGAAIAKMLAAEGCDIVLVARTKASLEAVKAEIEHQYKRQVHAVVADLADGANVIALRNRFPDIDIVVNNAGAIPAGSLSEIDEAKWRQGFELKVFGYINMCREFYPLLKARGGGVIINIIGIGAVMKDPGYICGVSGNACLSAFTQALGAESYKDNIRVVGVSPGVIETDRVREFAKQRGLAPAIDVLKLGRRLGQPNDVASVVAYIASNQMSSYLSGVVLNVDCGVSRT
jgi:3-oxoacyl-[acyl-carrier protein] reductase